MPRASGSIRLRVVVDTNSWISNYIRPQSLVLKQINAFVLTTVTSEVTECRDPKDNFLLALCQDGRADFLITGDQDLLVLDPFHRTRIITWAMAETEPGLLTS